ncbi:tetratricopeptide repeat protein [Nonomuraea sp. 3N208]|uniref:tetratricopeptide repeat protein n=1 Tax=Nonomuraea sp. 3N208 TaxID=3457421 RepID=UPI003FD3C181
MRRVRVLIATVVPLSAGALAWWGCVVGGVDLDTTGIIVGLVVLVPATPLAIWAGAGAEPERVASTTRLEIGEVPRRPRAFQRRPQVRGRIEEILAAGRPCCLIGAKGVGKTQLAAAHARSCLELGIPVAWLAAEHLADSLQAMAAELGLLGKDDDPAAVQRRMRDWLAERREPYLLVLDNAVDPDAVAAMLPATGVVWVLITSTTHAFERLAEPVAVERFTAKEALDYLRERVGPGDVAAARVLVRELDRLPLALAVAAAGIVGPPRIRYSAYLERLRGEPIDQLLARPSGEAYPRGVAQAILLALHAVSGPSRDLLGELSVLSPDGVDLELLRDASLTELAGQSLVSFSRDGSTVLVHRLVQRVVRESVESVADLVERAARRLRAVEDVADADTWRRLPYITAVAGHAAVLWEHAHLAVVLEVRQAIAAHLLYLNDGVRAIPILAAVAQGWELLHEPDHPAVQQARHQLATAHEFAGRFDEAVNLFEEVVADRTRTLGARHPDTLHSRARLASSLSGAGRFCPALFEEVIADQARVLGAEDSATLTTRFNHALAHSLAARHAEAVTLFEGVSADQARVLGLDHPDTLVSRGRLASAVASAGRPDQAIEQFEQTLAAQERVIGADHPDTLITRFGLASAYEAAGALAQARAEYAHVAEHIEAVLGPDQPMTAAARQALARLKGE